MLSFLLYHFCPDSEQSRDLPVLIHVDFFRGGNLREARHGSPRGWPRGEPSISLKLSEVNPGNFKVSLCETLVRRTCGGHDHALLRTIP